MFTHSKSILFLSTLLILLTACDQGSTPDNVPDEPNEQLAWAMANALADDEVREDVHTAMDASPWYENKLVLGSFLDSEQGSRLKKELENQLGNAEKLENLLDELPEMDFYLSYEEHREIWEHANEKLMVVCVTDVNATSATAYTSDEEKKLLDSPEKVRQAMEWALFSLHPEEMKFRKPEAEKRQNITVQNQDPGIYLDELSNESVLHDGMFGGAHEYYFYVESNESGNFLTSVRPFFFESSFFHSPEFGSQATITKDIRIFHLPFYILSDDEEITIKMFEIDGNDEDYYWESGILSNYQEEREHVGTEIGEKNIQEVGDVAITTMIDIHLYSVDFN